MNPVQLIPKGRSRYGLGFDDVPVAGTQQKFQKTLLVRKREMSVTVIDVAQRSF